MVVEEESPPKAAKLKVKRSSSVGLKVTSSRVEELDDEEEDELSDDEEDTYDIDDSSFEADSATIPDSRPIGDEFVGREKSPSGRHVMTPKRSSNSRSRSRLRTFASGFVSPGRFASTLVHTPTVAPRHVEFNIPGSPSTDESPLQSSQSDDAHYGARDDIRSPEPPSAKSRIPKDRELGLGPVKTPIPVVHGRPSGQHHEHRAFAVWGHDESDSNASDSEA